MAAKPHSPVPADICLVLEGTYPYVFGGVSTWVHQLLTMFPEWKFALFFLGAQKNPAEKPKYQLPPNVTMLEEVYLFDEDDDRPPFRGSGRDAWKPFYEALRKLGVRKLAGDQADLALIASLMSPPIAGLILRLSGTAPRPGRSCRSFMRATPPTKAF